MNGVEEWNDSEYPFFDLPIEKNWVALVENWMWIRSAFVWLRSDWTPAFLLTRAKSAFILHGTRAILHRPKCSYLFSIIGARFVNGDGERGDVQSISWISFGRTFLFLEYFHSPTSDIVDFISQMANDVTVGRLTIAGQARFQFDGENKLLGTFRFWDIEVKLKSSSASGPTTALEDAQCVYIYIYRSILLQ